MVKSKYFIGYIVSSIAIIFFFSLLVLFFINEQKKIKTEEINRLEEINTRNSAKSKRIKSLLISARKSAELKNYKESLCCYRLLIDNFKGTAESEIASKEILPTTDLYNKDIKVKAKRMVALLKKFDHETTWINPNSEYEVIAERKYRHENVNGLYMRDWGRYIRTSDSSLDSVHIALVLYVNFNESRDIYANFNGKYTSSQMSHTPPSMKWEFPNCRFCNTYKMHFIIDEENFIYDTLAKPPGTSITTGDALVVKLAKAKKAEITRPFKATIPQQELKAIRETLELYSLIDYLGNEYCLKDE